MYCSCVQNILYRLGDLGTCLCLGLLRTDKSASAAGAVHIFGVVSIKILLYTSAQQVSRSNIQVDSYESGDPGYNSLLNIDMLRFDRR